MLPKLVTLVFVLGVVPGALWATGQLPPPHAREDLVSSLSPHKPDAETEWLQRVGAICVWERKRARALGKAFHRATTPADVRLLLESAIHLSERSAAVFKRLEAPFAYRREARTLRRLFRRERAAMRRAREAVEQQNRTAFFRALRALAEADAEGSRILGDLGVDGCGVKPVSVPERERVRTV